MNTFNLTELYKTYFPETKEINETGKILQNPNPRGTIHRSIVHQPFNKIGKYGNEIWHPLTLESIKTEKGITETINLEIEACTLAISGAKTVIKTPINTPGADENGFITHKDLEGKTQRIKVRRGTVKEIFNINDYTFTIRGFVIGKNRKFPENEIEKLKYFFDTQNEIKLFGGYPEIFLDKSCKIIVNSLEFPEMQGKAHWIKPFTMVCQSDFIEEYGENNRHGQN